MDKPRYCPPFVPMAEVLSDAKEGKWVLETFHTDEKEAESRKMSAMFSFAYGDYYDLVAGDYVRLHDGRDTMMTDTPMERRTNQRFVEEAAGGVLVGGLGIGMVPIALMVKPSVIEVTVIEKDADIIELVGPQLQTWLDEHECTKPLIINHGDVFTYETQERFSAILMDIWPNVSADNWPQMKELGKKYRRLLARSNGTRGLYRAWRSADCQRHAAEDRAIERDRGYWSR